MSRAELPPIEQNNLVTSLNTPGTATNGEGDEDTIEEEGKGGPGGLGGRLRKNSETFRKTRGQVRKDSSRPALPGHLSTKKVQNAAIAKGGVLEEEEGGEEEDDEDDDGRENRTRNSNDKLGPGKRTRRESILPMISQLGSRPSAGRKADDVQADDVQEDEIGELQNISRRKSTRRDSVRPPLSQTSSMHNQDSSIKRLSVFSGKESQTAVDAILDLGTVTSDIVITEDGDADVERIGRRKPSAKDMSIWERLKMKPATTATPSAKEDRPDSGPVDGTDLAGGQVDVSGPKAKRFRVLARMIKNNLAWTREMESKHEDDEVEHTAFVVNTLGEKKQTETLVFDVNKFKAKNRSYGALTPRLRRILMTHPLERKDEEVSLLKNLVDRLKCFDKYSRKVKQALARVIYYESFEDGRVIIQQGHVGVSFYFITAGKVTVKISARDKTTGQQFTQVLGELSEGSTFGELALLHNIKRTATIVCRGHCEFLRLDKADFETVLRTNYENEWTERLQALLWLPQFKDWTKAELESCNNTCKLKEYSRDKIIFGPSDPGSSSDYVHFVVFGECRIVRELFLGREDLPYGQHRYHLLTRHEVNKVRGVGFFAETRLHHHDQVLGFIPERKLWTIGTLKKGHFFGIGEDMRDTYILSKDRTDILLVPRVQFMKLGRICTIGQMREDLNNALPSNGDIYRHFYQGRKWDEFKCRVVEEVVQRKAIPHTTTLEDVPLTIRHESLRNSTDLQFSGHLMKPHGQVDE